MTTVSTTRALEADRRARLLAAVAAVLVAAYALSAVPAARAGHDLQGFYDGWLQGTAYVVLGAVALLRPLRSPVDRRIWSLVAIGAVLRAIGYVIDLGYVRQLSRPPDPSLADAFWLAADLAMLLAVWTLVRTRARGRSVDLALDALVVAFTVAGLAFALLYPTLVDLATAPDPGERVAIHLAYPAFDIAALVVVTGALARLGWRSNALVMLATGIAVDVIVDAFTAYQVSIGTDSPGSALSAVALAASAAISFSGWVRDGEPQPLEDYEFSRVLIAAALSVVALGTLVYADVRDVPAGAILLPAAALLVGMVRAVLTVRRNTGTAVSAISAKDAELVRFQSLVETSDDFIAIAGLDGQVMYVNPAGRRLVGIEDRDVTRMTITDFLTEEGLVASVEVEQPAVVQHGRWSGESTLRDHRGGPPIPVAISSFLMRDPENGEPLALATVQRDISERVAAQSALERLADDRQRLLDRLVQAQEDERARIAGDVHDDSVQALAAVELRLGLLRRQLADSQPPVQETAETLATTVSQAIGRLRALLFDLESPALDTDLAAALAVAAENAFDTRIPWRITGDATLDLPESQRVTAYRVARESMANVVRHADAHQVEICLRRVGPGVEILIEDDGRGFDPAAVHPRPGHLGIPAMTDRATVAGGRLSIERREEGGTRVRIWLPSGPDAQTAEGSA